MSKRFTDNAIWKKSWFRALTSGEKNFWFYLKDECDAVGLWSPDYELARFQLRENIDFDSFPSKTNGNVEVLENGKWFLVDFCDFQYGELRETCKPHQRYIADLKKHGLFERVSKGYSKGTRTLEEKEEEKEKEEEEEKPPKSKKETPALPDDLFKIPHMLEAWQDWMQHRKEIKKPLTPTAVKQQYEQLRKSSDPVAMIRNSIAAGYQGLFEPKTNGKPKQTSGSIYAQFEGTDRST